MNLEIKVKDAVNSDMMLLLGGCVLLLGGCVLLLGDCVLVSTLRCCLKLMCLLLICAHHHYVD